MPVSREEAASLALAEANRTFGYPREGEELVILHEFVAESEAGWAFPYNTRTTALTGDLSQGLGYGFGPIVVARATGEVCPMPGLYTPEEALRLWEEEERDAADPDFVGALGEEFRGALSPPVPGDIITPQDGYEVWWRAFEAAPTPATLAALTDRDVEQLRASCAEYFECPGVSAEQVRVAVSRTLARWPA
jgi:hypothetical protein